MRRESKRKDGERKDCMRKEREWKVKGLFWLFGLIESGLKNWRKERSIFFLINKDTLIDGGI